MQIPSARFQPSTKATAQLAQKSDSQSFGLEFDPFGGVKDTFRTGAEAAGEFLLGATPGVGIQHRPRILSAGCPVTDLAKSLQVSALSSTQPEASVLLSVLDRPQLEQIPVVL